LPVWFNDHHDARIMSVQVYPATHIGQVPLHIRRQARVYHAALVEAKAELRKRLAKALLKSKGGAPVAVLDVEI
jgi:hypothetical protein